MVEITANLHMHTPYSDGEKYHRDIAEAAARSGIDAVIVTDHNVHVCGVEGYQHGVLVLSGEEVHDCRRAPQVNHCLVYNAEDELSRFATRPQALIDEANKRNGMAFLAHPFEHASPISADLAAIPWVDWGLRNFTGIEIWNYMSEFKARLWSYPAAIVYAFLPSLVISGPFRSTLRKWDELLNAGARVVAIGNSDAHGTPFRLGPIRRAVLPYEYLFRCVNTHLLLEKPLTRDVDIDRRMIYDALRAGHAFVGYDLSAPARGFSFTARSGMDNVTMGDELKRRGATQFEVLSPRRALIQLLRNGRVIASHFGQRMTYTNIDPGVYRVEVHRTFRFASRGWIYSNPIYVR